LCDFFPGRSFTHKQPWLKGTTQRRYQRVFELPSPTGRVELKIQQGGAGRFLHRRHASGCSQSNQIVLSVPTELADSLTHAIGKAADYSGNKGARATGGNFDSVKAA